MRSLDGQELLFNYPCRDIKTDIRDYICLDFKMLFKKHKLLSNPKSILDILNESFLGACRCTQMSVHNYYFRFFSIFQFQNIGINLSDWCRLMLCDCLK